MPSGLYKVSKNLGDSLWIILDKGTDGHFQNPNLTLLQDIVQTIKVSDGMQDLMQQGGRQLRALQGRMQADDGVRPGTIFTKDHLIGLVASKGFGQHRNPNSPNLECQVDRTHGACGGTGLDTFVDLSRRPLWPYARLAPRRARVIASMFDFQNL